MQAAFNLKDKALARELMCLIFQRVCALEFVRDEHKSRANAS